MKIRMGTRKDIPALAKLISSLAPWADYGINDERAKKILLNMPDKIYVAEKEGELAGFITVRRNGMGEFGAYLRMSAVKESFQKQGSGKALLEHAIRVVKPYARSVFCVCHVENKEACAFVEAFGFSQVGIMQDLYQKGYDEVLYRKQLR
ncbi:GNAT family N-acetyltransferase [Heliobacterium undosum]|uniref:GNAT family N-acetyltransferase n=1 Tax=Heliomicrobium undosum TaxID=121734 RepID=A0A845L3S3_9FIRM|nr:GNAT family N-acetyltransferase [Heliomicrobium undosum]MZP30933.1 GNAT family N-acetyltransferase [Heliomicrobium undosum]